MILQYRSTSKREDPTIIFQIVSDIFEENRIRGSQEGQNGESDLEWIDLVGIDRVATSNKKKLVLAKMNYQQRQEKNFSGEESLDQIADENLEKNVDKKCNVDDSGEKSDDELEHFIQNYSVVQYSIRSGDLTFNIVRSAFSFDCFSALEEHPLSF